MATTAPTSDRPHKAAKRYIYAWGDGRAEGNARDARPARRQGRRPRRDDQRRPADPARLHDHDRSLQRLLRQRRAAPGRPVGRRPRGGQAGRGEHRQGLRRPGQPAARQRPLRRQVLDARDDGHGPQPGPQRSRRSHGLIKLTGNERFGWDAYRRFIQMFGRIVMEVSGERFDHALEATKAAHGAKQDTDLDAAALQDARHGVQGDRQGRHRAATSPRTPTSSSTSRSRPSSRRGSASAPRDYRKNQNIPRRPGHGRQRRDDGLRQHGRRLRHGRGVHPRPEHRREGPVRRVPDQRPGRGRRGRHPDRPQDRPDADRDARGLRRVPAHRPAARGALPRRPGPRVHDRARPAVHAPDAVARSGPRRPPCASPPTWSRKARSPRKRRSPGSSPPTSTSCCATSSTRPRSTRRTRIAKGLNASPGAAVGRAVFSADTAVEWVERGEKVVLVRIETSPDDFHGMAVAQGILTARGGATSHAAVVARQIGKPCVAGCAELVIDYATKTARCDRYPASASRKATRSASTARPARSTWAPSRP